MLRYIEGNDIFSSNADALVNPVNCTGTMGKGLAREFKRRFPECVPPYRLACDQGKLEPGILMLVHLDVEPRFWDMKRPAVILFPTKKHWRGKSKIEWIDQGLGYLKSHYQSWNLGSIAMPPIGCGLGGLRWSEVKSVIEKHFSDEPVEVEIYVGYDTE